jgi:hypothetical protein
VVKTRTKKMELPCSICTKAIRRSFRIDAKLFNNNLVFCSTKCYQVYQLSLTTEEKFWSKVDKTPGLGPQGTCWIWTGLVGSSGYGEFCWRAKKAEWGLSKKYGKLLTHRLSYSLANGPIPDSLIICHSCDVPSCVNPAHLRPGTHQDNAQDRVDRKRQRKGESAPNALFTNEEATAIKIHLLAGYSVHVLKYILPFIGEKYISNFAKDDHWVCLEVSKDDPRVEALRPAAKEYMDNAVTAKGRPLTATKVKEIKKLLAEGVYLKPIAKQYGCSISMVSAIRVGRTWADI